MTRLDPRRRISHRFPQFLPDGRHFLFFAQGTPEGRGVYLASLERPEAQRLFVADTAAVVGPSGHLLFVRRNLVCPAP